ncbi:MAG: hypothetical protein JWL95_1476 [Gemmatimonadetes bacterium]|nr:hypothetical protein [Gemmatimonadota bacterium]
MIAMLRGLAYVLVFLGVLELTCRIDDRIRFGTPMMSRILSSDDLRESDGTAVRGRPNARYQKWVLNEHGLRGPSFKSDRTPGLVRVVAVGASETFGLTESAGREYPRQLEDSLNAARAQRPGLPAFEVLNASLPGMSLPSIERDLRNRVRALAPDIVLVYPSPSFYVDRYPPHATVDGQPGGELPASRAYYPRIIARLDGSLKSLVPAFVMRRLRQREIDKVVAPEPEGWRFTTIPEERLRLFDRDLRVMVGAIRQIGAVPVLATHANAFMNRATSNDDLALAWVRYYPRATATTLIGFDSAARDVTLRVAQDSGAVAVDVAAALARSNGRVFSDFVHFTDLGAAEVATALRGPMLAVAANADARRVATTRSEPNRASAQ